ncbi:hypothetical protein BCR33DRAFT_857488 [Rhizoclosmatium globosum]|uniref:Transferase n=1 Tax=Rhizoclosmatium globosum TaxID=329046 RepID=A0A1Y2B5P5_9FUNG|nr:hypothetical protein BCR33DRAFT_857488 [Rhizoclosmatium globosum]|eukprot:ORY30161.1 hypothetical protein BCR33DRAFT_857488 [Rhizoclosmatium globosum]
MPASTRTHILHFLKEERSKGPLLYPTVSTISFFDKPIPIEFILERVQLILESNPWLTGRLVTNGVGGDIHLQYDSPVPEDFAYTQVEMLSVDGFVKSTEYAQLVHLIKPHLVKIGAMNTNKNNGHLFRVMVVNGKALVVSLAHMLGDGHTFYQLMKMLDVRDSEFGIRALVPERVVSFNSTVQEVLGKAYYQWLPRVAMPAFKYLSNTAVVPFEGKIHKVNSAVLAGIKNSYTNCNYDWAFVPINFRGKRGTDGPLDKHAGNYWIETTVTPAGPYEVRKQILNPQNGIPQSQFPSSNDTMKGSYAVITNWSSFHHDLQLPNGLTPSLHLPIFLNPLPSEMAVIFRPNKNELAILHLSRTKTLSDLFILDKLRPRRSWS